MYEDKQGGEEHVVMSSNNTFGSVSSSPTTTIQNPNYKFTFEDLNISYIIPKEEYGMMSILGSGSGVSVGSDHDPVEDTAIEQEPPPAKKKRYHRHTARQIQDMEAIFEENPHPDNKQRRRLSQQLGLTPQQIKFWFQNKRTQIKAKQDRSDNVMLKAENDSLRTENHNLKSSLQCLSCPSCANKLRHENSFLRQQHDWLGIITSMVNHPSSQKIACFFPETCDNNNNMLIAEEEKATAMDTAVSCVQELVMMCDKTRLENESVCLNEVEFRKEASRAKAVVMMNSITLVKTFLDAEKWSEMFSSIVSRARTVQKISSGVSGETGFLLLMYAELQVIYPLVPARDTYFLRYVEHNAEVGKWMIVDFPIDKIKPASATTSTGQYRRKPSGCIIREMPNGYSEVTWVEQAEVEEKHVQHKAVREYVKSGVAFGAERWLAVLKRQCERMASFMATNITNLGVIPSAEARKNLMKLSQRMVRIFCVNISNTYGQTSTKDTVRIMTMKVCGGLVPYDVSVTYLPFSHHQVFDLLRNNHRLSQLEILFNENSFEEVAHIANGSHPGNCISLLRINVSISSHNVELMLQETCTDNSGSLVVYSTISAEAVQLAMNGEDPSKIPLLPLGFSVVPAKPSNGVEGSSVNLPSCFLTVALQDLGSNNNRMRSTVNCITSALVNDVGT